MLSAWQIVSLDYSEWIDAVGYADLDGRKKEKICLEILFCLIKGLYGSRGVMHQLGHKIIRNIDQVQ
jgi:hypothetical protein